MLDVDAEDQRNVVSQENKLQRAEENTDSGKNDTLRDKKYK